MLTLVMAAALCAMGQTQQPAVKPETSDSTTGAITGKVINENGQPLAGALVQVRAAGGNGPGQMVNTNREGEFRADGLDRGSYLVMPSLPTYTPQLRDLATLQSVTHHVGDSVTLTLIKGGVVTGAVTDMNGEPVVAVSVRVQMSRDANGRRVANGFSVEKLTDDRGIYRVYGLLPGTYVVNVHFYAQYGGEAEPITVTLTSVEPNYRQVVARQLTLTDRHEEHTAFRFTVDDHGNVTSTDLVEELFVNDLLGKTS